MSMKTQRSALLALGLGAGILATAICPSLADGIDEPFRAGYQEALNGKNVVFIPVAQAVDLAQGWFATMKKELEPLGVSVTVRDPNFNSSAGAQAIENLINEKPAVIVVQNPDVQTYAKLLQRAEQAGIFVIQLNMRTSYNSTAFVGVDWVEMGEKLTKSVVKACEGKSGKIAILQGALSAAASAYTLKGIENVLAKNKQISVVSNQAADWDASKAKAITQTVLKQHPDLCGIIGFWDGQDIGTEGTHQVVIPNLPGLPDNINRASDGNFWVALTGMRSPAFDLALRLPDFRRRMAKRLPPDEWMYPNINVGCVIKITEEGKALEALWDRDGTNHPSITSMREHRGYLYIGGLVNNRIGRYKLKNAREDYVQYDTYWKGTPFWSRST